MRETPRRRREGRGDKSYSLESRRETLERVEREYYVQCSNYATTPVRSRTVVRRGFHVVMKIFWY
jgi:hypothetical protein